MATYTTRTAMTKPSGSASPAEAVDIAVLNANADKIDKFLGCILVNDGVTPADADLFDGAIVKEKTSGIIWEARSNGAGSYTKIYIRYPYSFVSYYTYTAYAVSGTTPNDAGWNTYHSGKNSSSAQLNGSNFWVAPIKGIYDITSHNRWATNATGFRSAVFVLNGTNETTNTEVAVAGNATVAAAFDIHYKRQLLSAGDVIGQQVWQNSGGALDLYTVISVHMVEPVQ